MLSYISYQNQFQHDPLRHMLDTKWMQTTFLYVIFVAGLNYSSIVGNSQNFLTWLDKWLKPVIRQSSYWNRCYQATVNGWSSYTFHSNCDGKGPTVTIIRVGKYIFGGYTKVSWSKWHAWSIWSYHRQPSLRLWVGDDHIVQRRKRELKTQYKN